MTKLTAIFFDVGGTLIEPYPSVGAVYAEVGRRHGIEKTPDEMERAFRFAWVEMKQATTEVSRSNFRQTSSKEWWRRLVAAALASLDLPANEDCFEDLYHTFSRAAAWRRFDDVMPVFEQARKRRLYLGVISNFDERLRPLLTEMGLSGVDSITLSCEVGAEKPAPEIFRAALRSVGVKPERALHVGDSYEEDVLGAKSVGMQAILLDRAGKREAGMGVVRDLREIFSE